MYISGIGIVFTRGRGIGSLERALEEGWKEPSQGGPIRAYRVGGETLADASLTKKIRRADKFAKMAVFSAFDACLDSGISMKENGDLGIILATAFGPHSTTFSFIDDMLDYGDKNASPTKFSNSVHNAAASYISSVLDCRGPAVTLAQFSFQFQNALALAGIWLNEGRCRRVLCGCSDELNRVMEYVCGIKLENAKDGRIRPFSFSASPLSVPGEGSVFFMLTKEKQENSYGKIAGISFSDAAGGRPDITVIDADGMSGDETGYRKTAGGSMLAGYSPVFGSMPTISAFNLAVASLMMKKKFVYASPVSDNPYGVKISSRGFSKGMDEIECVGICGSGKTAIINIVK
jgi:3-oxoacyl-[acyl-carrier-protein] synthase II